MGIGYERLFNVINSVKSENGQKPDITLEGAELCISYQNYLQLAGADYFLNRYSEAHNGRPGSSYDLLASYRTIPDDPAKAGEHYDLITVESESFARIQLSVKRDGKGNVENFNHATIYLNYARLVELFPKIEKAIKEHEEGLKAEAAIEFARSEKQRIINEYQREQPDERQSEHLAMQYDRNFSVNRQIVSSFIEGVAQKNGVKVFTTNCVNNVGKSGYPGFAINMPYYPGRRSKEGMKPIKEYQEKLLAYAVLLREVFGHGMVSISNPKEEPTNNDMLKTAQSTILILCSPKTLAEKIKDYDGDLYAKLAKQAYTGAAKAA